MNSVMQCLNCLTPFVNYFEGKKERKDIQPKSKCNGKLCNVPCTALRNMINKAGLISLACLKGSIGSLYSSGSQADYSRGLIGGHEMLLVAALCTMNLK